MRLTGSLLASLGAALLTATAFGKEPQAVCGKFSRLLDEEGKTTLYDLAVYAIDAPKYGGHKYASLDADGVDAVLYGGCPTSHATADPCILLLRYANGSERKFEFRDQERFLVVRLDGGLYAVTNLNLPGKRSVVAVDQRGITRICDNL
jgi:hypothetical protein